VSKVGAACHLVGCTMLVFGFHLLVLFRMCWHAHSFSHNWLCQRFTKRK